jgi:hypothetical protein
MEPTADVSDPAAPSERPPRGVFVGAATVAFVVPWVTQFGGPAWWSSPLLPVGVWLLMGGSGAALVVVGGRIRRIGTALVAGDALGALLFVMSFFVTIMLSPGGGS